MQPKKAIITGASGGIGSAISTELAKAGYTLVLIGNQSTKNLADICKKCSEYSTVYSIQADLSNSTEAQDAMNQAIKSLGSIDLLVNCAGISYIGLLTDMSDSDWDNIVGVNLSSVFYCCRSVISHMVHKKSGRIINISSIWGTQGASCEVAYSATKGGLNSFTKALAKELAPSNISVNALSCGMIDTAMNACFSSEEINEICEEIPAGRMGSTAEVAKSVRLLAEAPSYLTGQIITIDGGWQ